MDDGIPCERNDPEAKEENLIKAVGLNRHDLVALRRMSSKCLVRFKKRFHSLFLLRCCKGSRCGIIKQRPALFPRYLTR